MSNNRRIASLLSSATEILYALELGDSVVAVGHECDFPLEAREKPRVTFSNIRSGQSSGAIDDQVKQMVADGAPLYEIDRKQLIGLAPDLIVTQAQCDVCAVKLDDVMQLIGSHPALHTTDVVALNPMSLDDILQDVLRVGEAAGCDERAKTYVAKLRERVDAIRAKTASLNPEQRPRVACFEWIQPLMLAANWMPELIEIAGGQCSLTERGQHSGYNQWDEVRTFDPEVIVVMPCGFDLPRTIDESRVLHDWEGWSELTAVRGGRVCAVDANAYFNRSGPRMVDSLELLAHLLHPQEFPDTSGIFEAMYWKSVRRDSNPPPPLG